MKEFSNCRKTMRSWKQLILKNVDFKQTHLIFLFWKYVPLKVDYYFHQKAIKFYTNFKKRL